MKIRLAAASALFAAIALLTPSTAHANTPSSVRAGNGTSNFYLSGTIGFNSICGTGTWAAGDYTNYDSGANQVYHFNYRSSGPGIIHDGWYIDGVKKSSADEAFITVSGHGAHALKFTAHCPLGSPKSSPTVTR